MTMQETKKQKCGYEPVKRYFIRFLKENNILKKYLNAFNQRNCVETRKKLLYYAPTDEQLYNLFKYMDYISDYISFIYNLPPITLSKTIIFEQTKEGVIFWSNFWKILKENTDLIDNQLLFLENNKTLCDYEYYENGTKYWV